MRNKPSTVNDSEERALQALLRAIAAGDRELTLRLLAKSPRLAQMAVSVGATRADPKTHFLKEIGHYIYAGDTALHIAAAAYQRDIAEELVSGGTSTSARNRRGAEPLHYAADGVPGSQLWDPKAQSTIVEFLIRTGANPDAQDKAGVTPLHRAVRTRSSAAAAALLANGADARHRNGSGSTPLHLAVQDTGRGGSGSTAAREEQAKIIRMLLNYGASMSDKDTAGRSVKNCIKSKWILALVRGL